MFKQIVKIEQNVITLIFDTEENAVQWLKGYNIARKIMKEKGVLKDEN